MSITLTSIMIGLIFNVSEVKAGIIERYFDYENTSTVTADNLNNNFDVIINEINGALTNENIKTSTHRLYELLGAVPAAGTQGRIVYNTVENTLNFDTGTSWYAAVTYLGTAAQGDILYYNGTNWAKLAASTSGNVLKTQGTSANPAWTDTVPNVNFLNNFNATTSPGINKIQGIQLFTANGTFTAPSNITKVYLTGCGGGGGGGGAGTAVNENGGGGGSAMSIIKYPYTVTPAGTYSVVIGAGGAGGAAGTDTTNGVDGVDTVWNSAITIKGGNKAVAAGSGLGGTGGAARSNAASLSTGGTNELGSTAGANGHAGGGGAGGGCPMGLGGGGNQATGDLGGFTGTGYGGGGGGGWYHASTPGIGGSGASGVLMVEW